MLQLPAPLTSAIFVQRRDRFTAVVAVEGASVLAHVPTSSRARELLYPGAQVMVAPCPREGRVTQYDLLLTKLGETLISVDARVPNRLLEIALRTGRLPAFAGWTFTRREVQLGESRLDFLVNRCEARCWIEAKSVTLVRDGTAFFPDAATERGTRHLRELIAARVAGDRAVVVFIIQRTDADRFAPNTPLDPVFAGTLTEAAHAGVEILAYGCEVTPAQITIAQAIPVHLDTMFFPA